MSTSLAFEFACFNIQHQLYNISSMDNIAFSALYPHQENSRLDITVSDLLLDQIEKQTFIAATSSWTDFITRYCIVVRSTLEAQLMVDLTVSLKAPTKTEVFVDARARLKMTFIQS